MQRWIPYLTAEEVVPVADSVLQHWSRPPAPVTSPRLDNVDRDDRRWLWAAVLALLALESWIRRTRSVDVANVATGSRPVSRNAVTGAADPERVVARAVSAALLRARLLALIEAAAWGLGVAALSAIAGAAIAAAIGVWRWQSISRASAVRALERAQPDAANLFVTADELGRHALQTKPSVRARVFTDAAARAQEIDVRLVFPLRRLAPVAAIAVLVWTVTVTVHFWRARPSPVATAAGAMSSEGTPARSRLQVKLLIEPPAYTGLKPTTMVDPEQLQTVEGSAVVVAVETSADHVTIDHDGVTRSLTSEGRGRFSERLRMTRTGYLAVVATDGARRTIPIVVSPDALPAVHLTAPGRDLVYDGGNPRISFDARASDDFGLRTLALRYTKVSGSGENYEFQEGEIPLTVSAASSRDWSGRASRSLSELGLKDGDMLVYRAVATDARPGDGSSSSDAFIIEVSKLGVAAGDAFTLPRRSRSTRSASRC